MIRQVKADPNHPLEPAVHQCEEPPPDCFVGGLTKAQHGLTVKLFQDMAWRSDCFGVAGASV